MKQGNVLSILGCGFLGCEILRLASRSEHFTKSMGSYTGEGKGDANKLQSLGAKPIRLKLDQEKLHSHEKDLRASYDVAKDFFTADAYVIAFPPRRRLVDVRSRYPKEMALAKRLLTLYCEPGVFLPRTKIILISSTAVYGNRNFNVEKGTFPLLNETAACLPETLSGVALMDAEKTVLELGEEDKRFHSCVLRLGGLVGLGRRHPKAFFDPRMEEKKTPQEGLENWSTPRNLIHVTDAAKIIKQILLRDVFPAGEIFNVVCDAPPVKRTFGETAALIPDATKRLATTVPRQGRGKIIANHKLQTLLGYEFVHKDLAFWSRRA